MLDQEYYELVPMHIGSSRIEKCFFDIMILVPFDHFYDEMVTFCLN